MQTLKTDIFNNKGGLNGNIKDNYGAAYIYNGHGDVVKVANSSGTVTKNYDYDAFGVISSTSSTDSNPWRYCGEYYDTETDNIYLRARYYDVSLGAFISEDPVRDGVNWYSYCGGNPVNFTDPSGLLIAVDENLSNEEKKIIFGDLQALTDYELYWDYSNGIQEVKMSNRILYPNNGIRYAVGNSLLKFMTEYEEICTITRDEKDNRFREKEENGKITIYYNFEDQTKISAFNNEGEIVKQNTPNFICLAHELIHGYHDMRNITKSYEDVSYEVKSQDGTGKVLTKNYIAPEEELFTSGLGIYSGYRITENSIRAEHNLNLRGAYFIGSQL